MAIPLYERAVEAARYIGVKAEGRTPRVLVVLGSGLGGVADAITDAVKIPYAEIPHFVRSTIEGHEGTLIVGSCNGIDVAAMKGRFHFYEGYSMEEVTLPVRTFAVMGVKSLILTNAAGGTAPHLSPGSLMVITDHINMMGDNPLRGANDERFGPRFPDMTHVYADDYIAVVHEVAREMGITLAEGVYLALRGPSYETPAEVRVMRKLGGDALGMSTVPEAIVARHCGMRVLAISCITNIAAGLTTQEINHEEVMEVGARAGKTLSELIVRVIPCLLAVDAGRPA
ncbi:MAG TPA: purine-nucleoside phosphorylase [Blastocatellia bacterium]|nr:purine-nucleoside phosphorylase [Blastocatellia bacterium]